MSKKINIKDLMEDKKFCDEQYFLMSFCCKVMEDIGKKLIESEGRENIQNHDIELEIEFLSFFAGDFGVDSWLLDEDGTFLPYDEFWAIRSGDFWEDGWSEFQILN